MFFKLHSSDNDKVVVLDMDNVRSIVSNSDLQLEVELNDGSVLLGDYMIHIDANCGNL